MVSIIPKALLRVKRYEILNFSNRNISPPDILEPRVCDRDCVNYKYLMDLTVLSSFLNYYLKYISGL